MAQIELNAKERQALKARAHGLEPVVLLGAQGLTPAVMREIDRALAAHELIKVRVPGDERELREAMFARIADELNAARVQAIGKLVVLYRPLPEDDGSNTKSAPAAARRKPLQPAPTAGQRATGARTQAAARGRDRQRPAARAAAARAEPRSRSR
jgi:putative YhbY family RNA-binding protein